MPDIPIGVETWGTGALSAPLHARLSEYERAFELPLWNPYQGLGEPYAAQGDGSPYSPFELLRALLPYSLGNYVTVLAYYLSAVCLFLFLRDLGLTEGAAIVGGIGWMLSGALSLHVARPEFGDQLAMLPVLLWAAQRALRLRTLRAYVLFAVASGISALAGHIQIAMIASVLVIAFIICSARLLTSGPVAWFRQMSLMLGVFVLGNGLAAFYLLPLAEALRISSNRNGTLLSYIEMPYANIVAFFYPLVFGHLFQSWIGGTFPDVVDWNNLYAYAGTWPLVLVVVGLVCVRNRGQQQFWFFFFCVTALILLLRFVSFPLIAGFDMVPIFGRQSPKHSQGVAVLCLTIAAAIAVDHLRNREDRRVRWAILVAAIATLSTILTMIAQHGTPATLDWQVANIYIPTTLLVCAVVVLMVWLARRGKRLPPESAPILIGGVVVAEASMYIPLGNGGSDFLLGRLAVFGLIVVGSCGLALHARWLAGGAFAVALAGYASLIVLPAVGLPSQFDVDSPPPYMQWLRATGGDQFRTFGIAPDWSSIDRVQDISAVGPLAPQDYSQFIKLASSQAMFNYYVSSSNFLLLNDDPSFNLVGDYDRNKAVFDWFGVKYLVIDHANFNPEARTDDQALLAVEPDVQVAYDDGRITILASGSARPKAEFWGKAQIASDNASIIDSLQAAPGDILGVPKLEAPDVSDALATQLTHANENHTSVDMEDYRPNSVRLRVQAPSAGVVVLKDSFFPGWQATLNGVSANVVRVNGIVRGVIVPQPGDYEVEFVYRPTTFVTGVWLSIAVLLLLIASLVWDLRQRRGEHLRSIPAMPVGADVPA